MSQVTPTPGAATSDPRNDAPGAFPPSTNVLDRETMPSARAEAAREKSAAVMAALKSGDAEEASRLMGKNENAQGQFVSTAPWRWIRRKFQERKGGGEEGDRGSVRSEGVEREVVVVGGKEKKGHSGGGGDVVVR